MVAVCTGDCGGVLTVAIELIVRCEGDEEKLAWQGGRVYIFGLRKCDVTGFTQELPLTTNSHDLPSILEDANCERSKKPLA